MIDGMIGGGMYYDPWSGETGKVSSLLIDKNDGKNGVRYLDYNE